MDQPDLEESKTKALWHSFAMIIVSELGDKTFLIAAILAMRYPRSIVFAGAFGSLVVMSVLSAEMGHILPSVLPRTVTQLLAAGLFLVFGVRMMLEAREMKGGSEKIQEEMKEVEEELELEAAKLDGTGGKREGNVVPLEEMEEGGRSRSTAAAAAADVSVAAWLVQGTRNLLHLCFGPAFVQSFVLTFLGEWGDKSQIATIALGANHSFWVVTIGTVVGHGCCTLLAVIGGRYLSTKISVKHVTFGGAILFLVFAVFYFHEAWSDSDLPSVRVLHPEHAEHEIDWVHL